MKCQHKNCVKESSAYSVTVFPGKTFLLCDKHGKFYVEQITIKNKSGLIYDVDPVVNKIQFFEYTLRPIK